MPPKDPAAQMRIKIARENLRAKVLELHRAKYGSYAKIGEHPEVNLSKGQVEGIVRRFGDRISTQAKKPPGRKSKLTKRCDLKCIWSIFTWKLVTLRFKRDLLFLAARNPYWGSKKLAEEVHMKLLNAQLSRPAGAVFQVNCPEMNFWCLILHFRFLQCHPMTQSIGC